MRAYMRNGFEENLPGMERVSAYGQGAFPILLTHLRSTNQDMRRAAIRFLLEFVANRKPVSQELADELIQGAEDPDPEIAEWACFGLAWLPRERAVPVLKRVLLARHPSHLGARIYAMRGVAVLGDGEAVPWIIQDLADPLPAVRREAVNALKQLGDPSADEEVRKLTNDPDPNVRKSVSDYFTP
jgi:HEAT repeat protein